MACLATTLALPVLAAPDKAQASCSDRKVAGTVIGGVGGALIGNSIARGGGGALIGGLGGAVLGHEVAGAGCHRARREAYYRGRERYRSGYAGPGYGGEGPPPLAPIVYYDPYGNPVNQGPAPADPRYAQAPACRTQPTAYYDNRGALVQSPAQICDR